MHIADIPAQQLGEENFIVHYVPTGLGMLTCLICICAAAVVHSSKPPTAANTYNKLANFPADLSCFTDDPDIEIQADTFPAIFL